jgi:hypothetical protein
MRARLARGVLRAAEQATLSSAAAPAFSAVKASLVKLAA